LGISISSMGKKFPGIVDIYVVTVRVLKPTVIKYIKHCKYIINFIQVYDIYYIKTKIEI